MRPIDYQRSSAVSQSQLKLLKESPRKYQATYVTQTLSVEPTDAMEFGSLVHSMTLQPHLVLDQYVSIPDEALTSNGQRRGKAWEAFVEANPGKTLIRSGDFRRANIIAERVWDHPFYKLVYEWQRNVEMPIRWTDEETGVECKGIPDIVCSNEWVIDIKTTNDLTGFVQGKERLTSSKIADFGYHLQGAFYLEGASRYYEETKSRFALIVVETKEPYRVYAMEIDEPSLFAGKLEMHRLLEEYKRRTANDDWSEEGERSLLQVSVPSWAL